jgi:hypothetical protein
MKKNKSNNSFFKQIKNNSVALISIFIAISSLGYNTWRNEQTEDNRNQRYAAFEILLKINELQQVVFYNYYDNDSQNKGNPRTAWSFVLTIEDLSSILQQPLPQSSKELHIVWNDNWEDLDSSQESLDAVLAAIDTVRTDTLKLLDSLE